VEGTPVSLGECRLGGGIVNANCLANNGNTYQPVEYLNGTYPITDSNGVHYNCDVRAHGGYGVPRSDCCRCNAADALSATRERMFKVGNAAYHCYYGCRVCTHTSPSMPPPPSPSPLAPQAVYNASCYFTPNVDATWTGAPLQGISSDAGFGEAAHLCLERADCYAIIEKDFVNSLLPQKRYVLRGEGALQPEAGTTTLVRNLNRCTPAPPPSPKSPRPLPPPSPTPPSLPPSTPILRMQTRPLFLVSFQATVQATVEQFDMGAYADRMRTALNTPEVGVTVAPGSVVVTTTAGADSQEEAGALVSEITTMASDPAALASLYGAPATVDVESIGVSQNPDAAMPPPPSTPPPDRSEKDHSYIALIIILVITLPVGAFLLYLYLEQEAARTKGKRPQPAPRTTRTPYARVTRDDGPLRKTGDISFKFNM